MTGRKTRPPHERMFDKVVPMAAGHETPCWIFTGCVNKRNGYGYIGAGRKAEGTDRIEAVHRIAYEAWVGQIPEGHEIHHVCEVRACCNPAHLRAVTRAENTCLGAGSPLTPEIVREIRSSPESGRSCAKRFGVTEFCISNIRTRRTWKWLA